MDFGMGQPRRPRHPTWPGRLTGGLHDRPYGCPIESSRTHLVGHGARAVATVKGWTPGSRLQQRVVHPTRRKQTRRRRLRCAGGPTMVSRAVHAFVVQAREGTNRLKRARGREYPLCVIRVESHGVKLGTVEGAILDPDSLQHTNGAEVVDVAGQPDQRYLAGLQSQAATGDCRERAYAARVSVAGGCLALK